MAGVSAIIIKTKYVENTFETLILQTFFNCRLKSWGNFNEWLDFARWWSYNGNARQQVLAVQGVKCVLCNACSLLL